MKRTSLTLILLIAFIFSYGQKSWVSFTAANPQQPAVTILEQNTDRVVLDIAVPGMYISEFENQGIRYKRLELTEFQTTEDVGYPELPMINRIIGIPGDRLARARVIDAEKMTLQNYEVYPFQIPERDVKGGKPEEFVINKDFYDQDKSYPSVNISVDEPGIWRDVKITGLHVVPFTYNAQDKTLEVITHLKVEVEFFGYDAEHLLATDNKVPPTYYRMYDAAITNFNSLGYTMTYRGDTGIKYLIITNEGALQTIQPLVNWKNEQGFKVEVKTLGPGFNTPQNFKAYIQQLYASDGLEYVLMVGDAYPNGGQGGGPNIVPMFWWAPSGEDASFSDTWYVCLDGPDDHYADLAIGRFVYDDLDELALQIEKTMSHYRTPDISTKWAENTILVAHQEEYPGKYTQCKEEIRTFNYALQTPLFTPCYGGAGATNTDIVNFVNNTSCGIFNYRGHGSTTEFWEWCGQGSFTNTHVQQLTNTGRLFVLLDVCCDNMDIVLYDGDCLCESFMKSPVASVAINGAIIPSYTIPNHDYDKEMYKAVFQEGIFNIGYVTNFANITVLNVHGDIGRSNVRTYLWLGDASLEPWTMKPTELTVSHDPQLFLGLSEYSVTVYGSLGPVENAMVCVRNEDGSVYGVGYTDAAGLTTVTFNEPVQVPGNAKVTVTSHNYLPYQAEIPVIPLEGAYVVKDSYVINDGTGNANGMMDYGESITLTFTLKNVGLEDATGVTAQLTTDDEFITFTTSTAFFGDIPAQGTATVENAFGFEVTSTIPDNHNVLFDVTANDGTNVWVSNFSIQGHAPVLELGAVTISDPTGNNNGKIDPGETAELSIIIKNTGSSAAHSIQGVLQSADPYITIESGTMQYGDLPGEGSSSQIYTVTADINTPVGHNASFEFGITASGGITGTGTFNAVIGQIPVAIIDLDVNHSSGQKMKEAMDFIDVASEYLTSMPDDLNLYTSVFVCLGIYSSNHQLSTAEGQALADFVQGGGMIYMEGGDTWNYDPQTAVHALFNISGVQDGTADLGTLSGKTGTFTEGMTFTYSGENSYIDHLEPIGDAYTLFSNQTPAYNTAIANVGSNYKTIGASFEFGGLNDGISPSTKEQLMKEYLDFFGLLPPEILANFIAGETTVCKNGSVQFTDYSIGQIVSWEWSFPGGDPASSTEQNPLVTYSTPGNYDVSLTVSNGTATHSITRPGYITVNDLPSATIAGTASICAGDSTQLMVELTGEPPWTLSMNNGEIVTAFEWPYLFWVKPETTTDYSIISVTDGNGCSAEGTDIATVGVNDLPTAIITGANTICAGDSAQITFELTGQAPWTIDLNDGTILTVAELPYFFWVKPQSTTDYSISSLTDANGCSGQGSEIVTIMVNELPTAILSGESVLCPGDSAQMYLELTGPSPWTVELSYTEGLITFSTIESSPFEPWYKPDESTTFTINKVTDANLCSNTGTGTYTCNLKPLPEIPVKPEGADSVDVYKVATTEFATTGSENGLSYSWQIQPENAGIAEGNELTGTITWNTDFTGDAFISVKAINDCGESSFSEEKAVRVYNSVGFNDLSSGLVINIYPNPNKGSFRLEVKSATTETISIRLINSYGSSIFVLEGIIVQGLWSRNIELKESESGIYYLQIKGTEGITVKKVEVYR